MRLDWATNKTVSARGVAGTQSLKAPPGTARDRHAEIEKAWCKP